MNYRWVLVHTGRWHAWPHGGRATVCGTVNTVKLRKHPARQIAHRFPEGAVLCTACERALRLKSAALSNAVAAPTGEEHIGAWLSFINKHLLRVRARVAEPTKRELAKRLSMVGSTADPVAVAAYEQIQTLLLTPRYRVTGSGSITTITRLKEALAALPPNPEALRHVATAFEMYRRVTGRQMSRSEKYSADTVVKTMLEIPMPEAYVKHLHEKGWSNLANMFHPNTLESVKKDAALRGVFGGGGEYMNDTADQLDALIVRE